MFHLLTEEEAPTLQLQTMPPMVLRDAERLLVPIAPSIPRPVHPIRPALRLTEEPLATFQQTGREPVRHLQQVLPATEEIIRPHIPDPHLKDLRIQDLQTVMSEQHSQEQPAPTGRDQGHSQHIQDRQAAQQADPIQVVQAKVQLQDLHRPLHTQGQVQAEVTPVQALQAQATVTPVQALQAQAKVTPVQAAQAQAKVTPVRAVRVQAEVTPVRAARVQAGAIQVRADQVQAGVILHQAAQAVPAQAEVTPEAVQVPADPVPARAQEDQDQAVAEGNY